MGLKKTTNNRWSEGNGWMLSWLEVKLDPVQIVKLCMQRNNGLQATAEVVSGYPPSAVLSQPALSFSVLE